MNRDREAMIIKAKYNYHGEQLARKIIVSKQVKLEELEYKLRERFDVSYDKKIEIFYIDDEKDRVVISFEDELSLALDEEKAPIFEIVVKPRVVDEDIVVYPQFSKGKPGECIEILIESQYLTLANAMREDTKAWGTFAYTEDSDIIKALANSEKIELSNDPPPYNVIATIRFIPGCIKYIGSTSQGVNTMDFGAYQTSYIIDDVRTVPLSGKAAAYYST